ncbi:nuclear transport factor 2 family protein [Bacillus pumilus]|uniref:nuclear transport factor 2 family protein n=1 Tax=Bacillus pumilus TaxID=1408 RepID=UPI00145C2300|nr:nuclear transport factor 2 family protein [Bacillus pumilus]
MEVLDTYFRRYDEAGKGQEQMDELLALFSDDVMIVLNGAEKPGIQAFKQFLNTFFHVHVDIKHMWDGWKKREDGKYETNWTVCGKLSDGRVYTAEGIDIAELDDKGKIVYLENVPKNPELFQRY